MFFFSHADGHSTNRARYYVQLGLLPK